MCASKARIETGEFSNLRLDAPCCLTTVRFHPRDPSLVLAGGFTGELFIWSVAREEGGSTDAVVASTNMQGHREKVTAVHWLPQAEVDSTLRHTLVLSAALDGKILLWAVDAKAQSMLPKRGFLLQAEHLPRTLKVRGRSRTEVGITAVSINAEDTNIISIGTEAGAVFQVGPSCTVEHVDN